MAIVYNMPTGLYIYIGKLLRVHAKSIDQLPRYELAGTVPGPSHSGPHQIRRIQSAIRAQEAGSEPLQHHPLHSITWESAHDLRSRYVEYQAGQTNLPPEA